MSTLARPELGDLVRGIEAGDRSVLARAITLVESSRADDQALARELVAKILPRTGSAHRIGVTGVPGAGKSTFIEAFGTLLTGAGHKVAVLAIDPSSTRTGGSVMGDKTRMQELARNPAAFVRPSPTRGSLGGVGQHTREALMLCEAAGFDVVIVETVGVGQSEIMVADMVDFFLVLLLAGGGDELQGMKRGILEVADMVAINKADGTNVEAAARAKAVYEDAMRLMVRTQDWAARVVTCSALEGRGLDEMWTLIAEHRDETRASGEWAERRSEQAVRWMWRAIELGLRAAFESEPALVAEISPREAAVRERKLSPDAAAAELLAAFELATKRR